MKKSSVQRLRCSSSSAAADVQQRPDGGKIMGVKGPALDSTFAVRRQMDAAAALHALNCGAICQQAERGVGGEWAGRGGWRWQRVCKTPGAQDAAAEMWKQFRCDTAAPACGKHASGARAKRNIGRMAVLPRLCK